IDTTFETSDKFFNLNIDVKRKYTKKTGTTKNGWDELERESTNLKRPGDLKESFDFSVLEDENFTWPNEDVPNFQSTVRTMFQCMTSFGSRMLSVIAIGLDLSEFKPGGGGGAVTPDFKGQGDRRILLGLKFSIPGFFGLRKFGKYFFGWLDLFQQNLFSSLEIFKAQKFGMAFLGVLLEALGILWGLDFWSHSVHRVLIPEEEIKRRVPCRSLVLFHDPDDDTMVTCLDGSNKYSPIRARGWNYHQLHSTYKY
ncbi:unnamed protein product, partial [Porites lobata]